MSCAPSGATPIVSTTPSGVKDHARCQWEEILLTGIPHGEPSRREIGSENYTRPARTGFFNRGPPSICTLSRTPRSWAIGGKAYRRSLSHDCTIASSPLAELDVCLDRMAAPILPWREEPDINTLCPPKHISETSCDGEGVCIFRSLVTTSPRIWCETRAWRELSELQSCDWAVQLA